MDVLRRTRYESSTRAQSTCDTAGSRRSQPELSARITSLSLAQTLRQRPDQNEEALQLPADRSLLSLPRLIPVPLKRHNPDSLHVEQTAPYRHNISQTRRDRWVISEGIISCFRCSRTPPVRHRDRACKVRFNE